MHTHRVVSSDAAMRRPSAVASPLASSVLVAINADVPTLPTNERASVRPFVPSGAVLVMDGAWERTLDIMALPTISRFVNGSHELTFTSFVPSAALNRVFSRRMSTP